MASPEKRIATLLRNLQNDMTRKVKEAPSPGAAHEMKQQRHGLLVAWLALAEHDYAVHPSKTDR